MITETPDIYIEKIDAGRKIARYYAMSVEPTLFGDSCLIRRWGRIGTDGQRMEHHFASEADAISLLRKLLRQKRRRGYGMRTHTR